MHAKTVTARLPGRPGFREPSKNQPFRAHPHRRRAGLIRVGAGWRLPPPPGLEKPFPAFVKTVRVRWSRSGYVAPPVVDPVSGWNLVQ